MAHDHWQFTRLGDLVSIKHGWPFKSEYMTKYVSGRPIVVGIGNFEYSGGFRFGSTTLKAYTGEYPKEFVLKPDDILLVMTCQTAGGEILGIPGRIPSDGSTYLHNQRMGKVVIKERKKVDIDFLYWLFLTTDFNRHLVATATGTKILHTAPERIESFDFLLPPLPIQRKIASILSAYDDLIENNARRIAILEQMARMLYQEWFVKFRFPGHEQVKMVESELGMIPEGWEVNTVSSLGTIVTGKTPSKAIPGYYMDGIMPFIKIPDMHGNVFCWQTEEKLSENGYLSQKNKTIPPNSICVSCIGTAGIVSISAVYSQTNQQINSIILNNLLYREFAYFTMRSLKEIIERFGSTGATMTNLSKGKFEALPVVQPASNIVERFHDNTSPLLDLIKQLQQANTNLRRTRDLLLPKLISGEIDISSWVESELAAEEPLAVAAKDSAVVRERVPDTPIDVQSLEQRSLWG
jgi:type I restriction enzyme S subunit